MCWEYITSSSESPACHNFLLSFFLPILPPHLAASQSIPINIQRLCTLSSCFLSGTTMTEKKKKKKKKQDEKNKTLLYFLLLHIHPGLITFILINQHLLIAEEARRRWRITCLVLIAKSELDGSCLGADYIQQAWLCATRDIISITMMLKHNTIIQEPRYIF